MITIKEKKKEKVDHADFLRIISRRDNERVIMIYYVEINSIHIYLFTDSHIIMFKNIKYYVRKIRIFFVKTPSLFRI